MAIDVFLGQVGGRAIAQVGGRLILTRQVVAGASIDLEGADSSATELVGAESASVDLEGAVSAANELVGAESRSIDLEGAKITEGDVES